jgi:hypothetical protein
VALPGDVSGTATLCVRPGRANKKLYYFEVSRAPDGDPADAGLPDGAGVRQAQESPIAPAPSTTAAADQPVRGGTSVGAKPVGEGAASSPDPEHRPAPAGNPAGNALDWV